MQNMLQLVLKQYTNGCERNYGLLGGRDMPGGNVSLRLIWYKSLFWLLLLLLLLSLLLGMSSYSPFGLDFFSHCPSISVVYLCCVSDCEISLPLSSRPPLLPFLAEIMPSSWLLSSRLEGLWKLRVYRPCCPQKKISYRLPLIYACCCCSSANEAVCDHGTAPSTLELRLPRCCLTPVSQRGHAHITLPNVLSLSQVSTSPFCLHAAIC